MSIQDALYLHINACMQNEIPPSTAVDDIFILAINEREYMAFHHETIKDRLLSWNTVTKYSLFHDVSSIYMFCFYINIFI